MYVYIHIMCICITKIDVERLTGNPYVVTEDEATHGTKDTCCHHIRRQFSWVIPTVTVIETFYCRHGC